MSRGPWVTCSPSSLLPLPPHPILRFIPVPDKELILKYTCSPIFFSLSGLKPSDFLSPHGPFCFQTQPWISRFFSCHSSETDSAGLLPHFEPVTTFGPIHIIQKKFSFLRSMTSNLLLYGTFLIRF